MKLGRKKSSQAPRNPAQGGGRTPVYSYHSLRSAQGSEQRAGTNLEPEKPTRSAKVQLYIRRVTFVALLAVLLFGLWLRPDPEVTLLSQAGTITRPDTSYREGVERIWRQRLLNQSKLTIQTDRLSAEIEQQFPEIESAKVELPLMGRLSNVVITPGTPALILVTQKGGFYINSIGKAMARVDQVSGNSLGHVTAVRDDSGLIPEPGLQALPRQTMLTTLQIIELCNSAKLPLESVTLPQTSNQLDITVKGSPYVVKLSLEQDPRQGIGALLALRDKFKADGINPSDYVDLRVPDKAFYK